MADWSLHLHLVQLRHVCTVHAHQALQVGLRVGAGGGEVSTNIFMCAANIFMSRHFQDQPVDGLDTGDQQPRGHQHPGAWRLIG